MADTEIILIKSGKDLKLDNAITIGSNESAALPGTIRYNSDEDRIEGYLATATAYNSTKWAPMTLDIASSNTLGGIKVGNNLTITSAGKLNAVSNSSTRKLQRVLQVSQPATTGDYTSINQCITDFFGYDSGTGTWPDGELANLNKTDFPDPSAQERYIILVAPGVYSESNTTIALPPYVSLIGESPEECIIKIDANVSISTLDNCHIQNLTIDLTNANLVDGAAATATGINISTSANNVVLSDVKFTTTSLNKDTVAVNINNVSGTLLNNIRLDMTELALPDSYTNQYITGITCNNAALEINNSYMEFSGYRASKTAILASNGAVITVNNCRLLITELNTTTSGHNNNTIDIFNSDAHINYSQIDCQGYDLLISNDTHMCKGINLTSDAVSATTAGLSAVQFIHYEDNSQYDEILVALSTLNFSTLFARDSYIKVSGADNDENNKVFKIVNIFTENISGTDYSICQLEPGAHLVDEAFSGPGTIVIKELYQVNLFANQINTTNETLIFSPSDGQSTNLNNFHVSVSRTSLNGNDPSLGTNSVNYNVPQIITVAGQNAEFKSIRNAVNSIRDSSVYKPYVVSVRPGVYQESGVINIPEYISVVGDSTNSVELIFNNSSGSYSLNSGFTVSSHTSIENLKITIKDNLDITASAAYPVCAISSDNLTDVDLGNTASESLAALITDVYLINLNISINATVPTENKQAIHLFKTTAELNDINISAATANIGDDSQAIIGYKQTLGNVKAHYLKSTITGSDSNVNAYGIYCDRSIITCNIPEIVCECSGSTSVVNRAYFATNMADSNASILTVSGYTNLIFGGSIKSTSGTTNQSLYADYNSTLIARSALLQADTFTHNDSDNSVPNSFLKTLDCYFLSTSGGLLTNITASDTRGYPAIINDSLHIGDPAGAIGAQGTKNVIVGIRTGTVNTLGNRNTFLGVDNGNKLVSGIDDTFIGYGAGANALGNDIVVIGSNTAHELAYSNSTVIIGAHAAKSGDEINRAIIIGAHAGTNMLNSNDSVIIGYNSAPDMANTDSMIIVGCNTASNITTVANTVIIGNRAGDALTTAGDDSIIIGHESGQITTSARTLVFVGSQAGQYAEQALDSTLIGYRAGRGNISGSTGSKITAVGTRAATAITSGSELVAIGVGAGESITTGRRLILIGSELLSVDDTAPGASITTGVDDIIIGSNSATGLTTGDRVIVMGHHSGVSLDGTNDMIILGSFSGGNFSGSASTDGQSIIIGHNAAQAQQLPRAIAIGNESAQNANATDLIAIGYRAGRTAKGEGNLLFGNYVASISNNPITNPLNGEYNVVMGNYAGFSLSSGSFNVIIGGGNSSLGAAGYDLTSGEGNVLMGYLAGRNLSTGDFNLIAGKNAGAQLAIGSRNVVWGADAAPNIGSADVSPGSISSDNLVMGTQAAFSYTTASQLLLIGYQAGYSGTTGINNVMIGNQSGYTNEVGRDVVYIGNKAGYLNTQSRGIAIGDSAGQYSSTAERFIYIGYQAGRGKTESVSGNNTGDRSVLIGYRAGSNITTGYQAVYIGYEAGTNNEEGQKSIMIGPNAGRDSSTNRSVFIGSTEASDTGVGYVSSGDNLICIGVNTGVSLTSGNESILIGSHAGESCTSGNSHIFIGDDAGRNTTTGNSSIFIGEYAGKSSVSGSELIAIGKYAGRDMGAATMNSVLIGTESGLNNNTDGTIAIGYKAGKMNRTGTGVIALGPNAGRDNETANNMIAIGANAGAQAIGVSGASDSIIIGSEAGSNLLAAYQNTVIGSSALRDGTNVAAIIAVGFEAAKKIGSTQNVSPTDSQYETLVIGYKAVSQGDIGVNCTVVGNRAGENVDNPRIWKDNTMIGPLAGRNSNLAVGSLVLGGANQEGTGGINNIIQGTGAGAVVGNPRVYIADTTTIINNYSMSTNINISLAAASYYFNPGDDILIQDSDQTNWHQTTLASMVSTGNTTTQIVFSTPYTNDSAETISTGASVLSLAKLSSDVGTLDYSKASANTLQGTEVGASLAAGSKNVAAGWQAMYLNESGRYNNTFGAQSGYNLRSDNSTCIGTRAGYSLDEYTYTSNVVGTDFIFTSNTNSISSAGQTLSGYVFGAIFEVSGSSKNDDRYKVVSSNASTIVVEGTPKIEQVGVPLNVGTEDISVNSSSFNFINRSITGEGLIGGNRVEDGGVGDSGIYPYGGSSDSSNISKLENFATLDTGNNTVLAFSISGSKYNDGIHYISSYTGNNTSLSVSNRFVLKTYDDLMYEVFDENVTISAMVIGASDSITSGDSFKDINKEGPLNVFFGSNKGVFRQNRLTSKYKIARPVNNVAIINTDVKDIVEILGDDNVIFAPGYNESFDMDDISETSATYFKGLRTQPYGQIDFYESNNTIVFENDPSFTINEFYTISGTANNNKNIFINSKPASGRYTANSSVSYIATEDTTVSLSNETVYADTANVVIFTASIFLKLNSDVTTTITGNEIIIINNEHSMGMEADQGAYIVHGSSTVSSTNKLALINDQLLPRFYDRYNAPVGANHNREIKLTINKDIYSVDSPYLANTTQHIHGYDLFFQTGQILPSTGQIFTTASTGQITGNYYDFSRLVAPCVIKDDAGVFYLVKKNDYPFHTLQIDTDATTIANGVTSNISFNSVCCYRNTANLAIMEAGVEYQVFGGNNNHLVKITPDSSNSRAIQETSVYLTSTSNITEYISNNMLISVLTNPDGVQEAVNKGYFKRIVLDSSNVDIADSSGNMSITFNSNTLAEYYALSGIGQIDTDLSNVAPLVVDDQIQLSSSDNDGVYQVLTVPSFTPPTAASPPYTIVVKNVGTITAQTGASVVCTVNEFRSDDATDKFDAQGIREVTGELSNFLRFTKVRTDTISDVEVSGNTSAKSASLMDQSLNFTVASWDDFAIDDSANISNTNVISLVEPVPEEYATALPSTARSYLISLGTPVTASDGNVELELRNITMPPVGFIDGMIGGGFNGRVIINTFDLDEGATLQGNLSLYDNGNIVLDDISVYSGGGSVSAVVDSLSYNTYYQDMITAPFKNLKPGNIFHIVTTNEGTVGDFMVNNVVSGTELVIDSRYSNISANATINFVYDTNDLRIRLGIAGTTTYGQINTDRYNLAALSTVANTDITDGAQLLVHRAPIVYYDSNVSLIPRISYTNFDPVDSNIYLTNSFTLDNTNILRTVEFDSDYNRLNNTEFLYMDKGDHLWIVPTSNIETSVNGTAITFANVSITGATVSFTSSNTITSASSDLSVFSAGQIIKVSGADDTDNNGFFRIKADVAPTTGVIELDPEVGNLPLTSSVGDTGVSILTNSINSGNISISNLAVYLPGQKLIIANTNLNNGVHIISSEVITLNNSLYLNTSVETEIPDFCKIERSVITDEVSVYTGNADTTFSTTSNTIVSISADDDFLEFTPGQTIVITNTTNNNDTYVLENVIQGQNTLYVAVSQTEADTSAVISKKITLIKLGEPVTTITDNGIVKYHYLDAQGNNLMVGTLAGQFTGSTSLSIHNIHIGNKSGQCNQGSGNFFIANETGTASAASEGATTYNNKFAIYKNNFIGVPSKPLIGGDFGSNRVGINTIDPDSLVSGSLESGTRLVVNGAVRASAHNTFTGTHIVDLDPKIYKKIRPGMILRSTGQVAKKGVIDTIVSCELTNYEKDKSVYGVYCHTDTASYKDKNGDMISEILAYCASVGEGCILVCTYGGNPMSGDYIMSSPIMGYGQLQSDDVMRSYTVGKLTEDIDWSKITSYVGGPDGKSYAYALVGCTYHCG